MLNEAENSVRTPRAARALNRKLFENLPAIIRESVKPMERIEFDQDHAGRRPAGVQQRVEWEWRRRRSGERGRRRRRPSNLAENVVNAAMRYRSQIPFVDNLLKEVGMSPGNLSDLSDLSVRLEKLYKVRN